MKANSVEVKEVPKPALVDDHDVVIKVTGSTVCGSGKPKKENSTAM